MKFDHHDENFLDNIQVHWETFQEGFEAAVKECGNFTDPITRHLMFIHFGIKNENQI